jgi:Ca2+-transporting ATPase
VIGEQLTHLESKLDQLAVVIGKYAKIATIISVVSHAAFLIILTLFSSEEDIFSNDTILKLAKIAIIAVVLLIVAIPEGLPLAVSIAMALSISSLKKDEILIKNIESVQTCAMLHDLCVGKTGTLTKGKLYVDRYQFANQYQVFQNAGQRDFFKSNLEVHSELKELVLDSILCNTDVRIEMDDNEYRYEPKGSPIEVGLIKFLMDNMSNEEDIQQKFISRNLHKKKLVNLPFDQTLKRKVVVRALPGIEGDEINDVRVYVKGAPEYIVGNCSYVLDNNVQPTMLDENEQNMIVSEVVSE